MKVRAFTYSRYHGKSSVGSTRLRVQQLIKYWPEYEEYTYGEHVDIMVYQKVYIQADWKFMYHFNGLQILDICDPDWLENQNVKQTIDAMDGVVVPTQTLKDFIAQMTDKPIVVIPDRHDLDLLPQPKTHKGKLKSAVWFGYRQNALALKDVFPSLERLGIKLTVISNDDPFSDRRGDEYDFIKFDDETISQDLQKFDVCILPKGTTARDHFKSNNKTTLAWLAGLPVVTNSDELEAMQTAEARNKQAKECYTDAVKNYDVRLSVDEMKGFIDELRKTRT